VSAETGMTYEGDWEAGVKHGPGMLYFSSGDRLEGIWKGGTLAGPVNYFFADTSPWLDPEY